MSEKERFIAALEHRPVTGRVPTFELVFFLTMEKFGLVHPIHMGFAQWHQMSLSERRAIIDYVANTYLLIARTYGHSAIFVQHNFPEFDAHRELCARIRELGNDEYFLLTHCDPTFAIPTGDDMMDFAVGFYEDPEGMHKRARQALDDHKRLSDAYQKHGMYDGFGLCSDYCFNTNPFFTPEMFHEFVAPYLAGAIAHYHDLGLRVIKHTDGNIMPILDQLIDCRPDALHSIDPQANVDLKEVKRLVGDRAALCGNVNCGLLQTGTEEEVAADVRRALRDGMPGGGYIFCTSNCVYTGMDLARYELMMKIWREEGVYA